MQDPLTMLAHSNFEGKKLQWISNVYLRKQIINSILLSNLYQISINTNTFLLIISLITDESAVLLRLRKFNKMISSDI